MKLTDKQIKETYINVLTSTKVNDIIKKNSQGLKLALNEHIWFEKQFGVRKANLNFAMTTGEIDEYAKCKMDVHYFANKYCHIKREDGTIGPMQLRDYQRDIIDLYVNNRYSILMTSRQLGKCNSLVTRLLVKFDNGDEYEITMGELYYTYIQQERKLTIIEKIKLFLYKALSKL